MDKLKLIEEYVRKCDETIESKNSIHAKKLVVEIVAVYEREIKDLLSELRYYRDINDLEIYFKDLEVLKAILKNYYTNLKREDDIRITEFENLKLKQQILNISNTNNNNSVSTSEVNTYSIVTVNHAIERILEIPDNILSKDDKEELEGRLAALEVSIKSGDDNKFLSKLSSVLKYVIDKGIEVVVAVLPYLGEVVKKLAK